MAHRFCFAILAASIALISLVSAREAIAQSQPQGPRVHEIRDLYVTHGGCARAEADPRVQIWLHLNEAGALQSPAHDLRGRMATSLEQGGLLCAQLLSAFLRGERVRVKLSYASNHLSDVHREAIIEELLSAPSPELEPGTRPRIYANFSETEVEFRNTDSVRRRYRLLQESLPYRVGSAAPVSPVDRRTQTEVPIARLIVMDRWLGVAQDVVLLDHHGRFRVRITCRSRSAECPERSVSYFDESGNPARQMTTTPEWMIDNLVDGAQRASPQCQFSVSIETGLLLRVASAAFIGCGR